jgi:peptidoglycan/LPS O-acetylase OafA/YrhL
VSNPNLAGAQKVNSHESAQHLALLDGERGVSALLVALIHLKEYFPGVLALPRAHLAVDFFFMLSGFVISRSYGKRLLGDLKFWDFVRLRFARLYPMIFFGVVLGIFSRLLERTSHGWFGIIVAAIFALAMMPLPRFDVDRAVSAYPLNGPLWSITYEGRSQV